MCSLTIGIMMHYIDIFFNWYHVGFDFTPWSIFCFRQKGEEHVLLVLLWPLCWWLTKRGRSIWVICMFLCFICMFLYWYQESLFYILLILVSRVWILVSRNIVCFLLVLRALFKEHVLSLYSLVFENMFMKRRNNLFGIKSMFMFIVLCMLMHFMIGIKSMFFIWYQEHVHFIVLCMVMHIHV